MPSHAANPLEAELYTAAVCRPRLPDWAVQSNASVNHGCCCISMQGKLARAGCAWYTDVISLTAILTFRVAPVTSDEPQQMLQPERAAGRGSDGVTGRVLGRGASDKHHSNWQPAAAQATAAGCGDWHAAKHRHGPRLTQWGEMARYRAQFTWAIISLSHGEGEMQGWRLNEANNMLESLFWGIWWREASLAR